MANLPKLRMSSLTTELVRVPLAMKKDGAAFDPTGDPLDMAFVPAGTDPDTGDWEPGDWETEGTKHFARCLVGPGAGGVELDKGAYRVWLRFTDDPEIPIRPFADLTVF